MFVRGIEKDIKADMPPSDKGGQWVGTKKACCNGKEGEQSGGVSGQTREISRKESCKVVGMSRKSSKARYLGLRQR